MKMDINDYYPSSVIIINIIVIAFAVFA